ncbi:type IV pilus assembly protein PilM [Patescibacteria group bacterium]|nr:type IV pilus assembly protein PilM [Patescibacteria group bacterium]MBU1448655.1 type IV pilus assembly protein PilM [Patescibacteria group bacterium]MBU2612954.1 type IV pilus assembly protein PilM [Patescibacteria group bacterium]
MGLFSSKPSKQSYLGVDFGMSGVKIVELLNEKGRARLVTYAYTDFPNISSDTQPMEDADTMVALLKKMLAKAKVTTKQAISALPSSAVFSSIISVPASSEKEIKEAVETQARKLIPVPLEEITLDSKTIDQADAGGGKKVSRVLITGAPKTLVTRTMDVFKRAGLELLSLETEAFAEIRSLVGKDRSSIMIIDIGAKRTNIAVVDRGVPFLNRSIATGGVAISQTISKTLGIPYEQADAMKRDIRSMQQFAPTGDITPILNTLLRPIVDEVRYSFNLYQGQSENGQQKRIDKIILTGGSALLPRLPEFLTSLMNVNAYLGDPWARVVYPQDLRPVLDEIGPRFTVSVGCAMRDIE